LKRNFIVPVPTSQTLTRWATDVHNYLRITGTGAVEPETILMQHQIGGEKATVDGLLMWDAVNGYPVVSKDGSWHQLVMGNGHAIFAQDANITAAAANTAYAIQFDTPSFANDISLDPTYPTRIVFGDGGLYRVSFTAQIYSTSGSTLEFRFWPRVNGVDVGGSTMVASLHNNGATIVVSRDSIFQFATGDYLEAMWATTSTNGSLLAHAATAYAPASPSATLAVSRVQQ
jgi:hypothetical protein